MATKTDELEALASALNRSAERLQTLWFSFLAVTAYLAISAFTTTHRMLLLNEGQTLPFLNLKLPLQPFYIIAPAFYVVMHAYVLIMLVLLARTARTFENALNALEPVKMTNQERERYRMRMENAIFLQIIVGAKRERSGANGWLLRTVALLSIAVTPVLVLLLFQVMFLPYHSVAITWWHRFVIVIDLLLVWTLWPSYLREGGERLLPRLLPLSSLVISGTISTLVVGFSILLATFPYEWVYKNDLAVSIPRIRSMFFGSIEFGSNRTGLFADRISLPNENLVYVKPNTSNVSSKNGDEDADTTGPDFSGRNLVGADFSFSNLRGAHFTGADLRLAILSGAQVQRGSFFGANLQSVVFNDAKLQGAFFDKTDLRNAFVARAHLQGAIFDYTDLAGANLSYANLQGADLFEVGMEVSILDGADFRGARLSDVHLEGASLNRARFEAASLSNLGAWRTRIADRKSDIRSPRDRFL